MIARELLKDNIPSLKTSDTGTKALGWMEEFRVCHLPIVNNVDFLGLISEDDIYNLNRPEEPLGNHPLSLIRPYVTENQHLYEVIKIISRLDLSLLPVLNEKQEYLGIINLGDIVNAMSETVSIEGAGGIITLELNIIDYSLTEIARIVESNDARIMSLYMKTHQDSNKFELTLKIDKTDLSRVLAGFYRFNYNVIYSAHESQFIDDIRNRYDALMNYLNI